MTRRIPADVVELVLARSRGRCERCYVRSAAQIHHRCASQMGGSRNTSWMNEASNLAHLCGTSAVGCHGFATGQPTAAKDEGWVVARGVADRFGGAGLVPVRDILGQLSWLTVDGERVPFSRSTRPANLVSRTPGTKEQ